MRQAVQRFVDVFVDDPFVLKSQKPLVTIAPAFRKKLTDEAVCGDSIT